MAKDPAFLFYPGDYLRDTQCLSEKSQVAYDRIMCEHMRNICISKDRLNFFTKRLNDEEKDEVLSTLDSVEGGFRIEWVAESIMKRRAYSDSRRKNRGGNTKKISKDMINTSSTYDSHMENENENENKAKVKKEIDNINTATQDLPIQDNSFQDKSKPDVEKVTEICALITTKYKNTQYSNEVQPYVVSLLTEIDSETLIKAIKNVISTSSDDHKFRPNFQKRFNDVETIKQMAQKPIKTPQTDPKSGLMKRIEAIAERKRKEWEEMND